MSIEKIEVSQELQQKVKRKVLKNEEIKNNDYKLALESSLQQHKKELIICDERLCDYQSFRTASIIIFFCGAVITFIRPQTGICALLISSILFVLYFFIKKSEIKKENQLVKHIQEDVLKSLNMTKKANV
jgi:hypothetical protein